MRFGACVVAIGLSSVVFADRLIDIPTAHKIPMGQVRYELRLRPDSTGDSESYLGIGATGSWEIEYRHNDFDLDHFADALDLTYNFISPITDFTPGFAMGVQDVFDQTADGRRPFFVVTFREGLEMSEGELPADVTLGISGVHDRAVPLVGVSIPLDKALRLLAEHDGLRPNAGLEFDPSKNLQLRWLVRGQQNLIGFDYQTRF